MKTVDKSKSKCNARYIKLSNEGESICVHLVKHVERKSKTGFTDKWYEVILHIVNQIQKMKKRTKTQKKQDQCRVRYFSSARGIKISSWLVERGIDHKYFNDIDDEIEGLYEEMK